MNKILILCALIPSLGHTPLSAATLVVDSFAQGPFSLSLSGPVTNNSTIASPFGSDRSATISERLAASGATMTSTLDDSAGLLSLSIDGQSTLASRPLDLRLQYSGGGPFSLLGYNAFEFDFSNLSGSGFLIVELGGGSTAVYGPSTNRISLNTSGVTTVPFSALNFGTSGSIASFTSLHFTFEADTEQFSMTLNDIRVVPEPSVIALAMPFLLTILLRRQRN